MTFVCACSAYGENVFILLQNIAVVGLIWKYGDVKKTEMLLVTAAFLAISGMRA